MSFPSKLKLPLLAYLLLFVACSNGATSKSLMTSANPHEDLVKAMKKVHSTKSYRMKSAVFTSGEAGEWKSVEELEFAAPNRWHSIFESNLPTYNNQKIEWIVIDEESYWKVENMQWQKGAKDMSGLFRNTEEIERITKDADVKFIGKDVLDGIPMLVYHHTFKNPSDKETKVKLTVAEGKTWIGFNNGLPHKIEMAGEVNEQGIIIKAKSTITYYDYNTDIKIEPPM
jgi:hypothetical protein